MMARVFILVLDSVGVGAAPDAALYGDEGADTLGHIADVRAQAQGYGRRGSLWLPHLVRLGLGEACRLASGRVPPGLVHCGTPSGRYGSAIEISRGKDTPSGHWEIAGVPVGFDWGYFPKQIPCFPPKLTEGLIAQAGLPGVLGNRHASGTEIIAEFGEEHIRTGQPICYTSADSVFQIAAHEEAFGLRRLYSLCVIARRLIEPYTIGRVIARPFTGLRCDGFRRTANRRDYAISPPAPTLLDIAASAGRQVISIGKIGDIFAHSGTGREVKADGNAALFDRTLEAAETLPPGGIAFVNFIDFDSIYGHRRDTAGYAAALENFDARLPELERQLWPDDLVIITADHGCDPTWRGSDHTREQIPILAFGPTIASGSIGTRTTYADIAATAAAHLRIPGPAFGTPF
jgi:phosphopentomutase